VRLQIEYLKPETLLQEHAIRDTVVVYGSTRIPEPAAARRSAEALRQALETEPGNGGPRSRATPLPGVRDKRA
jgi:hypothetical protein